MWCAFLLQMLDHHPSPKKVHQHWIKWQQACCSDICCHEIFSKTGFEPTGRTLQRLCWTPCSLLTSQTGWPRIQSVRDCTHHLNQPRTYARILFVDLCSAFNTVISDIFHWKLTKLYAPPPVSGSLASCSDDTTIIGLIQNDDKSDRRWTSSFIGAVRTTWSCSRSKKWRCWWTFSETPPITFLHKSVSTGDQFRFLVSTLSHDLKWSSHFDSVWKMGVA